MADAPKANAVVGQSGGPTGVINASLVGVIEEACKHTEIEHLLLHSNRLHKEPSLLPSGRFV